MNAKLPVLLGGPKTRKKPFSPHPVLGKEERREVLSVLKTGLLSGFIAKAGDHFLGGPKVKTLEALFCKAFGTTFAVAMNSATSALHAACLAVGIEPGDEVLVPPYTMSASASAIVMCGGIPVFVDIDADSFCMDPSKIERHITPKTKAILVVHLFGCAADMDAIMKIAKRHHLKVVEDCAQAPAATLKGRFVGTFGDAGIFSLNQHKTITTGEGGVAVTSDPKVALKMQLVRNHGEAVVGQMPQARGVPCLGWNYRLTELDAAVGIAQFKKLEALTRHRIGLAEHLTKRLEVFDGLGLPRPQKGSRHVYFVYPIKVDAKKTGLSRAFLAKALAAEGIPCSEGYVKPLYLEPLYQRRRVYEGSGFPFDLRRDDDWTNYEKGSCPVTEHLHEQELLVTGLCRYPLSKKDIDDVADAFEKVLASADRLRRTFEKNRVC